MVDKSKEAKKKEARLSAESRDAESGGGRKQGVERTETGEARKRVKREMIAIMIIRQFG